MAEAYVTRDELLAENAALCARNATLAAQLAQLGEQVATLTARLATLETRLGSGGKGMPGTKPAGSSRRTASGQPRQPRPHGFARQRSATPTSQVEHCLAACPHCASPLSGGWVARRREVIDLPLLPVRVEQHVYRARRCPQCQRIVVPPAELAGRVVGQQRLGTGLLSLIVSLREEARLPVRTIQWLLKTVHGLTLSVGAIVAASQQLARRGAVQVAALQAAVQQSALVQADETGWRENGRNGYAWTFATPTVRYFVHGSRRKEIVDQVLGADFSGVLCSDFYAAYHHYPGRKQRCWAHLLRESHELAVLYPADAGLAQWRRGLAALYDEACAAAAAGGSGATLAAQQTFERRLSALCAPHAHDPTAVQARLCRRIERHLSELFVFVAEPCVPADNNAAERSLRHLVTSRKISGGTRSPAGTAAKMALASLFGTWRLQGANPLLACAQLLTAPQA